METGLILSDAFLISSYLVADLILCLGYLLHMLFDLKFSGTEENLG